MLSVIYWHGVPAATSCAASITEGGARTERNAVDRRRQASAPGPSPWKGDTRSGNGRSRCASCRSGQSRHEFGGCREACQQRGALAEFEMVEIECGRHGATHEHVGRACRRRGAEPAARGHDVLQHLAPSQVLAQAGDMQSGRGRSRRARTLRACRQGSGASLRRRRSGAVAKPGPPAAGSKSWSPLPGLRLRSGRPGRSRGRTRPRDAAAGQGRERDRPRRAATSFSGSGWGGRLYCQRTKEIPWPTASRSTCST